MKISQNMYINLGNNPDAFAFLTSQNILQISVISNRQGILAYAYLGRNQFLGLESANLYNPEQDNPLTVDSSTLLSSFIYQIGVNFDREQTDLCKFEEASTFHVMSTNATTLHC